MYTESPRKPGLEWPRAARGPLGHARAHGPRTARVGAQAMFATRYAEISTAAYSYALGFNFDSISILVSFLKYFNQLKILI